MSRDSITDEQLGNFRRRVLQDSFSDASAAYWRRRARALEAAMPRPGDFTGHATPEDIEEQRRRIASAVLACSHRAELSVLGVGS